MDPKYVDVIVQRWQTLTGKKATLEGDGRTFEGSQKSAARERHESRAASARSRRSKLSSGHGHPDLQGLCLALADWSAELRLIERGLG